MEMAHDTTRLYDRFSLHRFFAHLSIARLMLQTVFVYGSLVLAVLYLMRKWGVFAKSKSDNDCNCGSGCH